MMPSAPFVSAEFVDGISHSIQAALDSLFQHENALAQLSPMSSDPERAWSSSLAKLESTVAEWQAILDAMGEQVRSAQESLADLDGDLNRSLGAFAAARKHLQGDSSEAIGEANA